MELEHCRQPLEGGSEEGGLFSQILEIEGQDALQKLWKVLQCPEPSILPPQVSDYKLDKGHRHRMDWSFACEHCSLCTQYFREKPVPHRSQTSFSPACTHEEDS